MTPEDIQRRVAGLIFFTIGVVGTIALLVATATSTGVIAFGTFYAPPTFVVLVISLFLIIAIEVGRLGLLGSELWQVEGSLSRSSPWLAVALSVLLFGLPVVGLAVAALLWVFGQLTGGDLAPKSETYVVGAVMLVYAAIRIPIALGWVNGPALAHAIGIRKGGPDEGESRARYLARTIVGMAIGVLALDALIVLANAVLAPGDTTFYPGVTSLTPLVALLWIVGLSGVGWIISESIRTRTLYRSVRAAIAAAALVPALVLDATVPLYPMVMGVARGEWTISVNDVAIRSTPQATPFVGRAVNPTPPASPSLAPDAKVSGLVRWGELPVRFVNVAITNNGRASSALTDANGRYEASVYAGTLSASVDVGQLSLATWYAAAQPAAIQVATGRESTYPTIQLARRIVLSDPATGAAVSMPITFRWVPQWQSLDAAVTYELRVFDAGAVAAPTAAQSTEVLLRRSTETSLAVTTLTAGRRYRWSVSGYITPRSGGEMLIASATLTSFTTR